MRAGRITAAALVTGCVVALAAPAAGAEDGVTSFGFSVRPGTISPGGSVTLRVTGCAERAIASAPALFDGVALDGGPGQDRAAGRSATLTVGRDAKPGAQYDVTFRCGSQTGSAPLRIRDRAVILPTGVLRTGLTGGMTGPKAAQLAAAALLAAGTCLVLARRPPVGH